MRRLITPIGDHRRKYIEASRGKRTRKRKRVVERNRSDEQAIILRKPQPPPETAILKDITVGYNSTHRALLQYFQAQVPEEGSSDEPDGSGESRMTPRRLAAVFVDRFSQAKIMHNHLPILIASASTEERAATRLVALPSGSERELRSALNVPRVSIVGVYEDAIGAGPLIELTKDKVPVIDGSWLKDVRGSKYLPLKMDATTTKVAVPPPKSVRKQKAKNISDSEYVNKPETKP